MSTRYRIAVRLYAVGLLLFFYGATLSLVDFARADFWLLIGGLAVAASFLVKPMRMS